MANEKRIVWTLLDTGLGANELPGLMAVHVDLTGRCLNECVSRQIPDDYRSCVTGSAAEQTLLRDEALAVAYHVDATPTMFINGVRKVGLGSPEE